MNDSQTIRVQPPIWALIVAVVIGGGFYTYGKSIEARDHSPTLISVSGEGKVTAAPDIAALSFGVQTGRKRTAKEAMDSLSDSMQAVFDAVKKAGIEEKDIATEQLSLNPEYDWNDGNQTLRGYQASQSLRVKVRDLDNVSAVLAAASAAGANQVGGVQFTIDDPEELRAEARDEAIAQAQAKAQTLADQLGMWLGKIKGFNEDGGGVPPSPIFMRAESAMDAGGAVMEKAPPLPEGEQEVRVYVNISYELK